MTFLGSEKCFPVEYVNIRGHAAGRGRHSTVLAGYKRGSFSHGPHWLFTAVKRKKLRHIRYFQSIEL